MKQVHVWVSLQKGATITIFSYNVLTNHYYYVKKTIKSEPTELHCPCVKLSNTERYKNGIFHSIYLANLRWKHFELP